MDPARAATARVQPRGVGSSDRRRRGRPRGDHHLVAPVDARGPGARGGPGRRCGDERAHPTRDGGRAVTGVLLAALAIGLPALAFVLWPLLRRGHASTSFLPLPVDAREQLLEGKRAALRTLRELQFEHESGHVSDADYANLRTRYENETAAILTDLDRLGPAAAPVAPAALPAAASGRGWRH